jgi:hypothetical protein
MEGEMMHGGEGTEGSYQKMHRFGKICRHFYPFRPNDFGPAIWPWPSAMRI